MSQGHLLHKGTYGGPLVALPFFLDKEHGVGLPRGSQQAQSLVFTQLLSF